MSFEIKIIASVFLTLMVLAMATAGSALCEKILLPMFIVSGLALLLAIIWL